MMNLEKLTPDAIDAFSKSLKKKGLEFSAFEIFLDALLDLIDPYADMNIYSQKVNKLIEQLPLSNLDQLNDFLSQYNDFHNRSIAFINSYKEITDNDRAEEYVLTLFDHFWDNSDPKNSFEMLLQKTDALIVEIINTHQIDMNRVLADEEHHIEILSEYIGKQAAFLLVTLMMLSGKMHEGEVTVDDIDRLGIVLVAYCALVALMNGLRLEILQEEQKNQATLSQAVKKVGRNDPCPCGSGKKYKKCCMHKEQQAELDPFADLPKVTPTHFPLSEKDVNDFYSLWGRLIDFADKIYCSLEGAKHRKLYEKDQYGTYRLTQDVLKDNYYIGLRDFLVDNFSRIVDEFIEGSRVSKTNTEILQKWKNHRLYSEECIIFERAAHGALVWEMSSNQCYFVYGLYDDLYDVAPVGRICGMLLLPFKGRIIYDGVLSVFDIGIGDNMQKILQEDYRTLRKEQKVGFALPKHKGGSIYQLKISIKGAKPPIWRRVLVEEDMTYGGLHKVIQGLFGWWDSHLHEFITPDGSYGDPDVEDMGFRDENSRRISFDLNSEGDKIRYIYDFGDDWEHEIVLERVLEKEDRYYPVCIKGRRNAPMEDCGGIWIYNELVQAHKEGDSAFLREHYVDKEFDPAYFDIERINALL